MLWALSSNKRSVVISTSRSKKASRPLAKSSITKSAIDARTERTNVESESSSMNMRYLRLAIRATYGSFKMVLTAGGARFPMDTSLSVETRLAADKRRAIPGGPQRVMLVGPMLLVGEFWAQPK